MLPRGSDTPAPGNWYPGPRSSIHTLEFLFPPPLKYYRVLQLTAISTIENVRFRGLFFFFWIDGKRSVFIVNFLDHFQEKAGWKAWKGNRRRKHDVLMGLYIQLVSCFRGAKENPIKILLQLWLFAFPCTFTWFFLTYDWGNLRQKCFSFHISKKNFIYLYVWSAIVPYTVSCSMF